MSSLQRTPGVTPYPDEAVQAYLRGGVWGRTRIEDLVADAAGPRPDAVAVVDQVAGRTRETTHAGLLERVGHAAGALAAAGLRADDTVVLQLPNTVDAIAVLLACFRQGVRPVLALHTHRASEIAGFLAAGDASLWILGDLADVDAADLVAAVAGRFGRPPRVLAWPPQDHEPPVPPRRPDAAAADELAFFQLSGGTTGASKLIPRAHREYAYSFLRSNELCGVDADTVLVVPVPLTHNFPMSSPGFLGVLSAGGRVVLCPYGDPASICAAVESQRGTHLVAVPPLVQLLLDSPERGRYDLTSLRRVLVGGARLAPTVARRVQRELGPLQQVYGMAEGLVCYTDPADDPELVATTQGRPMSPYDEVRVVDPRTGRPLPAGEPGELEVRGPYTIRGYYRPGPREAAAFTADGFYRTGDLVRRDPDGSVTVVGRTKEQINRGGEKISPAEVENALLRHPGVHDACVVGEPDPVLGERVVAYVVPRSATGAPDARTLRRHLNAQSMAAFKLPAAYHVVAELPVTTVGKVSRSATRGRSAGAVRADGDEPELDLLGLGFGPANMALAVAVREANEDLVEPWRAAFVEASDRTRWHEGMLFPDASMQVAFAKDLATLRNPRSAYTFLQFLADRDRLSDFVNRGSMTPLRVEFVEYLRWAAERLSADVTYSSRVEAITPVVTGSTITAFDVDISNPSGMSRLRSRHVALAAGLQPRRLAELPADDPRVWHSSEHLLKMPGLDPDRVRTAVVVGGGQSAAEVLLHLHQQLPHARLHAVHSRFGLAPSDSSPFANRIFDPQTVDRLFHAADAERARFDALHANTNDAVVAPGTLQTLYDLDYRDRWLGPGRFVWHNGSRVTAARVGPAAVEVDIVDGLSGGTETVAADLVVSATGYAPLDPAGLLGDHAGLLRRDQQGRPLAHRDYSARWTLDAAAKLFLVGQTRHQHGVSATLLSNIAVRAGEIVQALGTPAHARDAELGRADLADAP